MPTFPVSSCPGCNVTAMRLHAQNLGAGIVFVYDLNTQIIRKYNVTAEPCGTQVAPPPPKPGEVVVYKPGTPDQPITEDAQATVACGGRLVADEWPVDRSVQDQFNALLQARALNKNLVDQNNATTFARNLAGGKDPYIGTDWNLPQVAWEYPQGAGARFVNAVNAALGSKLGADTLAPGLGIYLFEYATKNVSVATQIGTGGVSVTATTTWDRSKNSYLEICDVDNNCAKFSLVVTPTAIAATYLGVFDVAQNQYPSPKNTSPNAPIWTWGGPHGGGGSNAFANYLRGWGVPVEETTNSCTSYTLTCAWQNGKLIGCRLDCN